MEVIWGGSVQESNKQILEVTAEWTNLVGFIGNAGSITEWLLQNQVEDVDAQMEESEKLSAIVTPPILTPIVKVIKLLYFHKFFFFFFWFWYFEVIVALTSYCNRSPNLIRKFWLVWARRNHQFLPLSCQRLMEPPT